MKKLCVGVAVAGLAGILVSAQQAGSVADEVLRLERAQGAANIKKDGAAYARLLADEYSYVHSNGTVSNKTEEVASTVSSDAKWTSDVLSETKVRVYGDAAIFTAIETLQGMSKGFQPGPRRITDVWAKRKHSPPIFVPWRHATLPGKLPRLSRTPLWTHSVDTRHRIKMRH